MTIGMKGCSGEAGNFPETAVRLIYHRRYRTETQLHMEVNG